MALSLHHDFEIPFFTVDAHIAEESPETVRLHCAAECPCGGDLSYKWLVRPITPDKQKNVVCNPEKLGQKFCSNAETQEVEIHPTSTIKAAGYYFCVVLSSCTKKIAISQIVLVNPSKYACIARCSRLQYAV